MPRTKTTTPVCVATRPDEIGLVVCDWCGGTAFEPDEEAGSIPCLSCDGSSYATVRGDLGPTHSYKTRPFRFVPCRDLLVVTRKGREERYRISELVVDPIPEHPGARGFAFAKELDGTTYHVFVTRGRCICDCAGASYESVGRANFRAHVEGRAQAASKGCVHADALALLLAAGLLHAE